MSPTFPKTWPGLERDNADKSVRQYLKPAFPVLEQGPTGLVLSDCGMSLRDWFAGQALSGLLACPGWEPPPGDSFAKAAYRQADDMMKARDL